MIYVFKDSTSQKSQVGMVTLPKNCVATVQPISMVWVPPAAGNSWVWTPGAASPTAAPLGLRGVRSGAGGPTPC